MATRRSTADARLPAAFTDAQYALPGSLARRYMRCGKAICRCKADPPVLPGPYLHLAQTRTLTEEQAQRYQPLFVNARRLRELLTELEDRSLRAFHDGEDRAVVARPGPVPANIPGTSLVPAKLARGTPVRGSSTSIPQR
ncbi:MAG: DUF6788 family protein [Mycobacteriales bacterium]